MLLLLLLLALTHLLHDFQVSILCFLNHLLLPDLVLLHLQSVQELVRLGEHLRDERIVVELLDLPDLSLHLEVLCASLVDVRKEILVFQIHSIVLSVVIFAWVVGGWSWHVVLEIGVVHIL